MEKTMIGIVGNEGRFGSRMQQVLQQAFDGSEWVHVSGTDAKSDPTPHTTAGGFDVLVMSTAIEQVETTNRQYMEALAANGIERVVININSVQESARQALLQNVDQADTSTTVVVNVHPYFGPQASLEGAKLIFCGTDIVGDQSSNVLPGDVEHNWQQLLQHLAETLPRVGGKPEAKPMRIVDLSAKHYLTPTGEDLSGTQLHDYIAAYTQAPYHILRLHLQRQPGLISQIGLPDLDIEGKKSSLSLAEAVIAQNPYAQVLDTLPDDTLTREHITQWLTDIRNTYKEIIHRDAELNFVTPNVNNLFNWLE